MNRRTSRQRVQLWTMAVGLIMAVGLFTVGLSVPQQAWGQSECSLATLQGTYIFAYDGIQLKDGKQIRFALAGQETYNGDGTMTGVYSGNTGGEVVRNVPYTGTYTVNADCSGTLTTTEETEGTEVISHYDQFTGPTGDELSFAQTDPDFIAAGFQRRVNLLANPGGGK
jgi:hypothetical protein